MDGFVVATKYDKATDAIVVAALSQAINWANANRPRQAWQERIKQGGIEQLQNVLRPGGAQSPNAKLLMTLLCDVKVRHGNWDLQHLFNMSNLDISRR
ncbi:hypothetical protein ACHAPS_007512 [Verticillium nonalfalfae]